MHMDLSQVKKKKKEKKDNTKQFIFNFRIQEHAYTRKHRWCLHVMVHISILGDFAPVLKMFWSTVSLF